MSTNKPDTNASWGGRFSEATDAFVQEFTASVQFDQRMFAEDIRGSRAHARMLGVQGVLTADEVAQIDQGLVQIEGEIAAGNFNWSIAREDVHMNVEARLVDLIGDVGRSCTPAVLVMTKSPPTSGCGYGDKLTSSKAKFSVYRAAF